MDVYEEPKSGFSGVCKQCKATHWNGRGEGFEQSRCACGEALCCSECAKCIECGSHVCPQCSIDITARGDAKFICSGCHAEWLSEQQDEPHLRLTSIPPQVQALRDMAALIAGSRA